MEVEKITCKNNQKKINLQFLLKCNVQAHNKFLSYTVVHYNNLFVCSNVRTFPHFFLANHYKTEKQKYYKKQHKVCSPLIITLFIYNIWCSIFVILALKIINATFFSFFLFTIFYRLRSAVFSRWPWIMASSVSIFSSSRWIARFCCSLTTRNTSSSGSASSDAGEVLPLTK